MSVMVALAAYLDQNVPSPAKEGNPLFKIIWEDQQYRSKVLLVIPAQYINFWYKKELWHQVLPSMITAHLLIKSNPKYNLTTMALLKTWFPNISVQIQSFILFTKRARLSYRSRLPCPFQQWRSRRLRRAKWYQTAIILCSVVWMEFMCWTKSSWKIWRWFLANSNLNDIFLIIISNKWVNLNQMVNTVSLFYSMCGQSPKSPLIC